jgi:hypothetical protein
MSALSTAPVGAAGLRAGDLLRLARPVDPRDTLMVPVSYPTLTHLEVLRVLPGGGNDGEDVVHLWGWDTQVHAFEQVDRMLAAGQLNPEPSVQA